MSESTRSKTSTVFQLYEENIKEVNKFQLHTEQIFVGKYYSYLPLK